MKLTFSPKLFTAYIPFHPGFPSGTIGLYDFISNTLVGKTEVFFRLVARRVYNRILDRYLFHLVYSCPEGPRIVSIPALQY